MMKSIIIYLQLVLLIFSATSVLAAETNIQLSPAHININDKASLQRGAKLFMNYCSGCHSLQYMRYSRMAQDIGIVDSNGQIARNLLENNLIFTNAKVNNTIQTAMTNEDSAKWFGMKAPDLSLWIRVKGADWVYTYLKSFYRDDSRPWGTNNALYPDVAMPNVLVELQGIQRPIYINKKNPSAGNGSQLTLDHLRLESNGSMNQREFSRAIRDIVNFLAYVATPEKQYRENLGKWVLLFLAIFAILVYLLKREYWKDIT